MFKTEESLVKTITTSIKNKKPNDLLRGNPHYINITTELNLGYGIPDIVVTQYNKKGIRKGSRKEALDYFDISILKIIESKKEVAFEDIFKVTKSSKHKIKTSLSKLLEDNLISCKREKFFSYKNYTNVLTDSIAIEAKLKDWKRALKQAYRYKWFSKRSFVFLPEEYSQPAFKNKDAFQKLNVGLAIITKDKEIKILHEPKEEKPYCDKMSLLLNECLLVNLSLVSKKNTK